jgi:hypothetical protein
MTNACPSFQWSAEVDEIRRGPGAPMERAGVDAPMRVLRRFVRPGIVAEIRERRVTSIPAFELLVFVDEKLQESEIFHGVRARLYSFVLESRCKQFVDGGWIEDPTVRQGEPS